MGYSQINIKYFILLFIFSCNVSHKLNYDKGYIADNDSRYYFNKGDSCHIVGFEEDVWAKYYFNNDTLNVISIYDSNVIPYINCVFENSNNDSLKVEIYNNGRNPNGYFRVALMDSNYNKLPLDGFFLSSSKYTYPIKYIQAFAGNARSDIFKLNIKNGGKLKVFLKYADYPSFPFNFHEKFFISNKKLKILK